MVAIKRRYFAQRMLNLVFAALILSGCAGGVGPVAPVEKPSATPDQAAAVQIPLPTEPPPASLTPTPSQVPSETPSPSPTATEPPTPSPSPTEAVVTLVGAGDIAVCGTKGAEQTAELIDQIPGAVFTAGDDSNEDGSLAQYTQCFDPTWGRFLNRMRPSVGNHDYMTPGARDYFQYFGAIAGEPGKGYYSYELGAWHIVVLNSNCNDVGCGTNSDQIHWLQADLQAHPNLCTLAYWHHPRFSSGLSGSFGMYPFWQTLYAFGADVVINGNDHDYERFAPQDPLGKADPEKGIREFVVGTGGAGQRAFKDIQPNSEVHNTGTFGVIKLTLMESSYQWEFIPVAGKDFTDAGSGDCHTNP